MFPAEVFLECLLGSQIKRAAVVRAGYDQGYRSGPQTFGGVAAETKTQKYRIVFGVGTLAGVDPVLNDPP